MGAGEAGNEGGMLLSSLETPGSGSPASPVLFPSDVAISSLTGVRASALGQTSPPRALAQSVFSVQRAVNSTFWFC